MAVIKRLATKKNFKNIGIGLAVIVAAVTGYLLITGKSLSSLIPVSLTTGNGTDTQGGGTDTGSGTSSDGNTNPGGGTSPGGNTASCSASQVEFPLPLGAGYTNRPNYKCEQIYIKNVQRYLNLFADNASYSKLTVDGKLGSNTMDVYQFFFGSQYDTITLSAYNNIINDLKNY